MGYKMTMPVAVLATLVALAAASHHHAHLAPSSLEPLKVKGSGFHARERVRVRVTPSTGDAITRRVRATGRGSFVLSFAGIQACGGIEGVATGNRGSHASFQSSSLLC
jgi:hypothetical protein